MEVSEAYQGKIGESFDFYYSISGWSKRGKIESLVHKVDQDPRWQITQYDYNENTGKLRLRAKILQNPLPLIIVVVAISAVGAGLFAWLSLDKIEKIITDPVGGLSTLGIVIGGLMALRMFKK